MYKVKRRWIVAAVAMLLTLVISGSATAANQTDSVFESLRTVFTMVQEYHKDGADLETFFRGAVKGGLEALGDRYTTYFSPDEFAHFMGSLDGTVIGIGVYLDLAENYVIVSAPIKGGPAHKAGLKTGDRILEVDGVSLVGATIEKAQALIRGKSGTEVVLRIERPAEQRTLDVRLVRALIQIPQVEYEMREDGVGYLALTNFGSTAATEFYAAVAALKEQGATHLVLDLRQNPGGYVSAAVSIASAFVPKGQPVLYEVGSDGELVLNSSGSLINMPTVVLIDGGSASAAEILAGAIQDYGAGKLVGTPSYGKGTVQQIFYMAGGAGLKVTIAEYFTGKRHKVDGRGLVPDYHISPAKADTEFSVPISLDRLIFVNDIGLDILEIQKRLKVLGYSTSLQGAFDVKMLGGVQGFQRAYGLPVRPILDSAFVKELNAQVKATIDRQVQEDVQLKKAIEILRRQ